MQEQLYRDFTAAISRCIPERQIFTDVLYRLAHGTDGSFYRLLPRMVVRVVSEEELICCLSEASCRSLPVTFRAAGTSLSGQAVSSSILLLVNEGWQEYEVLAGGRKIRLQPGVIGSTVNRALAPLGRKFGPDPASINSAMVGGIISNNASGMNCGIHENAYQTISSARIVLADGTLLDTGDAKSRQEFCKKHPEFIRAIEHLRDQVRSDKELSRRIAHKYRIKNTTGYSLNALLDFDDPFAIILHLMVGAEGSLAFMSEVVMNTVVRQPCRASSMVYFPDIVTACEAVVALKKSPVHSAELLDRLALAAVENKQGIPACIREFDSTTTAVLLETLASNRITLKDNITAIKKNLSRFSTVMPVEFTDDPARSEQLWNIRKGVFPAAGGMRKAGTTCLIEDVAYHPESFPEAAGELQCIIAGHGYDGAIIFGHALEGNLHFIVNQDFSSSEHVLRYEHLMEDVIAMTLRYGGSLKAEHGTGRNMAPFVQREWGEKGYALMRQIKQLFDPGNLLNPGVIINDDPRCHLHHFKVLPQVDPLVDKCIECGFCEVNCVSNNFTLSARQRIVVQREISRLEQSRENPDRLAELVAGFCFAGEQTCAGDGLCAASCPLGIDTGAFIKAIRARQIGPGARRAGVLVADHLNLVIRAAALSFSLLNAVHTMLGDNRMLSLTSTVRRVSGKRLPGWTPSMPRGAGSVACNTTEQGKHTVVYFPSCISRAMGPARDDGVEDPVFAVTLRVLQRAGYGVLFPEGMENLCCGTPWESRGMVDIADKKLRVLEEALLKVSENGRFAVLCDTSPCLYRMRKCMSRKLELYEPVEFIYTFLQDKLSFHPRSETVAVHSTCSTTKLGLKEMLKQVAGLCAEHVVLPEDVNCCGFAGDKGFTLPALNKHGLRRALPVISSAKPVAGYSNSRTCEIGCTAQTGIPYMSIMYLVDETTRPL